MKLISSSTHVSKEEGDEMDLWCGIIIMATMVWTIWTISHEKAQYSTLTMNQLTEIYKLERLSECK